jgi:DNA-binding response OmpR family regulator
VSGLAPFVAAFSYARPASMQSTTVPGSSIKVLVVEDDLTIAGNLVEFLELRGHQVDVAYDGPAAMARLGAEAWDVVVLDIGLPRADGYQVLHHLRERLLLPTPVLILTARTELDAKVRGFGMGADDYLLKPFAMVEAEARIHALHRRASGSVVPQAWVAGELRLDRRSWQASVADRPVKLMPRSMQLLERLIREPGEVVRREELERLLWPEGEPPGGDALRGQVYLLRRSLSEAGYEGLETVHGVGFRLRA